MLDVLEDIPFKSQGVMGRDAITSSEVGVFEYGTDAIIGVEGELDFNALSELNGNSAGMCPAY